MLSRINLNIKSIESLPGPGDVIARLPVSSAGIECILNNREEIESILQHCSSKFLMIVGPCSIHCPEEAIQYAEKIKKLSEEVGDKILLVMRVYFEKPRTVVGWKGLIYDPELDGTYNIAKGIEIARKLLVDINDMGVPIATETLDPVTTQYIADLVSWSAIGARTTESQLHRQLVSGLSMPVGFKNATDGSVQVAIEAVKAAMHEHAFLGLRNDGTSGVFRTTGNSFGHIVLRGGGSGPNYEAEYIAFARELLKKNDLYQSIIVDCSHANSGKDAKKQGKVLKNILAQKLDGEESLIGVMLESHLEFGAQKIKNKSEVKPGISITDECIGWGETETLIKDVYKALKEYENLSDNL